MSGYELPWFVRWIVWLIDKYQTIKKNIKKKGETQCKCKESESPNGQSSQLF